METALSFVVCHTFGPVRHVAPPIRMTEHTVANTANHIFTLNHNPLLHIGYRK
jgi:hypothetical protein